MLLEQVAHYNDLSPELREALTTKIRSYGKFVRYKFNISNPNPDPTKYGNIDVIWPNVYTLDPCVFNIVDKQETRTNKPKSKLVGLVDHQDEKGLPDRFKKIRVHARDKGVLRLDLTEGSEGFYMAMMIELHPKLTGGQFSDASKQQIVSRIDEQSAANISRSERSIRKKAMDTAEKMSHAELIEFANAMVWDSTESESVLRDKAEALAETDPVYFNDLVGGADLKYRALVKAALDQKLIAFDPAEYKFTWAGNKQPIAVLSPVGEKTEVEKLADWLQGNGERESAIAKKLESLLKGDKTTEKV